MFYSFRQNNTKGVFQFKEDAFSVFTLIEADTRKDAVQKAETLGIYFDGRDKGLDCICCGDRWSKPSELDTNTFPEICRQDVSKGVYTCDTKQWKNNEHPEGFIHYANGKIVQVVCLLERKN